MVSAETEGPADEGHIIMANDKKRVYEKASFTLDRTIHSKRGISLWDCCNRERGRRYFQGKWASVEGLHWRADRVGGGGYQAPHPA